MCKSILDIVSLDSEADPRINYLLKNTFGGSVLVKDFKSALKIAKENDLTCVTPDL